MTLSNIWLIDMHGNIINIGDRVKATIKGKWI